VYDRKKNKNKNNGGNAMTDASIELNHIRDELKTISIILRRIASQLERWDINSKLNIQTPKTT